MAAKSNDVRQHLLTRSDLAAMAVADDRVDAWLAGGELALVDMIDEEGESTAVYAATTDSLRDQLLLLLEQHGREGVVLGVEDVRAAMIEAARAASESEDVAEDVIAEHTAEEDLDNAIDDIASAIDQLVESSAKFPRDLDEGSDAPLALVDDAGSDPIAEPEEEPLVPSTEAADDPATPEAHSTPEPRSTPAPEPTQTHAAAPTPPASVAAPVAAATATVSAPPPVVQLDLQPVVEALQQVHLAVLSLGAKPQLQFDTTPITAALDHGIRALKQDLAAAADRATLREGVEQLRSTIEAGTRAVVDAVAASTAAKVSPLTTSANGSPSATDSRSHGLDLGAAIATAAIATGWGIAIWSFAGDTKLALGAIVCANLVGCCVLMLRRR